MSKNLKKSHVGKKNVAVMGKERVQRVLGKHIAWLFGEQKGDNASVNKREIRKISGKRT